MFFPRLIKQAKWVFVFLALVFGLGFVVFGVGGNLPGTGFGDILQGSLGSNAGPDAGDAREKIEDNPQNAAAHKELGEALVADDRPDEAILAYEEYLRLRRNDVEVKRTLAGLYQARGNDYRDEYGSYYMQFQSQAGGGLFGANPQSELGQALTGRIDQQAQTLLLTRLTETETKMKAAFGKTATLYSQVVKTRPDDEALLQLQLGDAAFQAQRPQLAIRAYERYIAISPDDPNAAYARQQISVLKTSATTPQPG